MSRLHPGAIADQFYAAIDAARHAAIEAGDYETVDRIARHGAMRPVCGHCGGRRWVTVGATPINYLALEAHQAREAEARELAKPHVHCPECAKRGVAPWPWDRERLAADALRLVAEAA